MKRNRIIVAVLALSGGLSTTLNAASTCDFAATKTKLSKETPIATGMVKLATVQVTAKDQNPIVAYFDTGKQVFCRNDYDTTATDARAIAATADRDHIFVVFSVDGGATGNSFARYTKGGWLPDYGKGGGPKVLVLLKIRKTDGEPVAGTYITARKGDGKTNSVILKGINFTGGGIEISAEAWYSPLKADKSAFVCTGKSPFAYSVKLSPDLKSALSTAAPQCK